MASHQKKYDILGVKNSMVYQNKKFACKIEKKNDGHKVPTVGNLIRPWIGEVAQRAIESWAHEKL